MSAAARVGERQSRRRTKLQKWKLLFGPRILMFQGASPADRAAAVPRAVPRRPGADRRTQARPTGTTRARLRTPLQCSLLFPAPNQHPDQRPTGHPRQRLTRRRRQALQVILLPTNRAPILSRQLPAQVRPQLQRGLRTKMERSRAARRPPPAPRPTIISKPLLPMARPRLLRRASRTTRRNRPARRKGA